MLLVWQPLMQRANLNLVPCCFYLKIKHSVCPITSFTYLIWHSKPLILICWLQGQRSSCILNLPPTQWGLTATLSHRTLPVARKWDDQSWYMTSWGYGERGLTRGEGMQIVACSAAVASSCQCNGKWRAHQSNVGQSARRPAHGLYLLRLSNLL